MKTDTGNRKVTLYIIRGLSTGKKYIGITNNLQRRLSEHRNGGTKGGQIIGEFELIHTEEFDDYSSARKREVFLKSGRGRQWMNDNIKTRPARSG
jgi:putative endonuclease